MKNLNLFREVPLILRLTSDDETFRFAALDIERNRLFFLSSHNFIYTYHLSSFHDKEAWSNNSLLSTDYGIVDLEPDDSVTSFDYLMEKEALLLGTSNGLLLLYDVDANATQVVGNLDGGVNCISLSPDGELLAIITGFGQILVMTHDWDLLYETPLVDDDDDEGHHVNGENFLEGGFEQHQISWRGDGKYFATMSVCSSNLLRKLKVWDRDSGALLASSEEKTFAGAVLEWMPSGAKIAAVYDRKAENECPSIVFFERNGLERSKFSIGEGVNAKVKFLKWNCSSDLLAGVVECESYDAVKIWYFSNNHWYVKHEIRYLKQDEVRFVWNQEKPLQLICWTLGGQVTVYNFVWITAVTDNSIALVTDGPNIHVTPLSLSLMPPPMYLFSLKFSSHVRGTAVYCKNSKNKLAAFLSDGSLCVVELPSIETWEELEGKEFNVEASHTEMVFGSILHLVWLDSHTLLSVSHYGFSHSNDLFKTSLNKDALQGFFLQEIELECSEDIVPGLLTCSGWHATVSKQNTLKELVIGIAPNPASKSSAFMQFSGGKIKEYLSKMGTGGGSLEQEFQGFSAACPWMGVALVGSVGQSKPVLFGLDEIGRVHTSGGIVVGNNCSSFSFYSNLADEVITHLLLATKQDLLFIVDIVDIFNGELDSKYGNFVRSNSRKKEENENYIHIWERGAKIVGVLHGDEAATILQTTRGNLECIYPRKLVLVSIINALTQKRFRDALLMVRRHRIDFNVIVDYCGWQAFSQSAFEFVRQVNNLGYITEFVCSVKNENVIEKLYKNHVSVPCSEVANVVLAGTLENCHADNKVSSILMAIRKALEEHFTESPARELCILTTLARSEPPLLEDALKRIKVIREKELSHADDHMRMSYPSAEEALKHLLWLADGDAVYDAALGLYDLKLSAIVALNAQKDPKEFLPFLQELERMPTQLMQYNIDLRLKRFEKALRHIASAGDSYYDDCMALVNKNPQLFPLALQLFTDPAKRMPFLEAWGDYLSGEKNFEDAATIYLSCFNLDKALKSYRAINNWSGVLTVAGFLNLGKDEVLHLAGELCEQLQALGKPGEAAKIALDYCGDVNSGVNLLISARDWEEALRVVFMHRREDLIKAVKDASVECASTLINEYEEGLEKVGKYLTRYLAVRQRRLLLSAKLRSEERAASDLDDDAASEASSNFSGMSAYTTGTRKSSAVSTISAATTRAREARRQRKRGKIRPGSAGEEFALVDHLKGMSLRVESRRELKSLLVSLMMFGEGETARKLQQMGENFQLSQMAAVKLAEETISTETINEYAHTLEQYTRKVRDEMHNSEDLSWRLKVFLAYE
ncbi:elongator complex protein 1-like isoform X1 [Vicia villosa]|uniref:elongator complex protein 1-like isoform X1 n=2 Tax=Vicia villosa TaxID=3911 RepID=UPI00273BFA19|nr:elongator complex protein 1-like isoform X1 [Vicia villosa]